MPNCIRWVGGGIWAGQNNGPKHLTLQLPNHPTVQGRRAVRPAGPNFAAALRLLYRPPMTDLEFDILDELYFVTNWKDLLAALGRPADDAPLRTAIEGLVQRGLVRTYFPDPDSELHYQPLLFAAHYPQMLYLATKAGLLAHTTSE